MYLDDISTVITQTDQNKEKGRDKGDEKEEEEFLFQLPALVDKTVCYFSLLQFLKS